MGMYTELQGTVIFNTEEIARAFTEDDQWEVIELLTRLDSVRVFSTHSRASWIPNGDIRKLDGKVVQFHTELKNYDSTIEEFLKLLPEIADSWTLESKYEECSEWTLHRKGFDDFLVNGDNSRDMDYYCKPASEFYPDFNVFDLNNLK